MEQRAYTQNTHRMLSKLCVCTCVYVCLCVCDAHKFTMFYSYTVVKEQREGVLKENMCI